MILGIDASRNRSGGAIAYLQGILKVYSESDNNITQIHIWAYDRLLDQLPNTHKIIKHRSKYFEKSILHQLFWQFFILKNEIKKFKCDILFNTDAGTVSRHTPCITLSQDMLSYEKGEMNRFGFGFGRLRLILLLYFQNRSFKNSNGVIFLTKYASEIIQKYTGELKNIKIIPHAVNQIFFNNKKKNTKNFNLNSKIKCIYISAVLPYKHQSNVLYSIVKLRSYGFNVTIDFVGGGPPKLYNKLQKLINKIDPNRKFTKLLPFVDNNNLPSLITSSDIFIFASSCENMPITLMEGMASRIPIASSNRGPMFEVLQDGGVYFNPESVDSITDSIKLIILDNSLREEIVLKSAEHIKSYSWEKTATMTFQFIFKTFNDYD